MRAIHSQGLAVVDVVSPSCVLIIGFFWRRASHGRLPVLAKFLYSEYSVAKDDFDDFAVPPATTLSVWVY